MAKSVVQMWTMPPLSMIGKRPVVSNAMMVSTKMATGVRRTLVRMVRSNVREEYHRYVPGENGKRMVHAMQERRFVKMVIV
jgi:hypothetical protein